MISSTVSYLVKPENYFVNGNVQFLQILRTCFSMFLTIRIRFSSGQTLSIDGGVFLT